MVFTITKWRGQALLNMSNPLKERELNPLLSHSQDGGAGSESLHLKHLFWKYSTKNLSVRELCNFSNFGHKISIRILKFETIYNSYSLRTLLKIGMDGVMVLKLPALLRSD